MKEKYIELVKRFMSDSKAGLNLNSPNRNLCDMEQAHKEELKKMFGVPEGHNLYGFVRDLVLKKKV